MTSILHLIETGGPGGAEKVFLELATNMKIPGHHSIAAVGRDGWLADQARSRGLNPLIFPSQGSVNLKYFNLIRKTARENNTRLIVAHLFGAAVYASMVGVVARIPVVSVLHGQSDIAKRERFSGLKRAVVAHGSRRVVFVSDGLKHDLQPILKLPESRCTVIENGIDMTKLLPPDGGKLKASLGLPAGALLIGAIGNLRRAKGYETLLQAAAVTCERLPGAHFIVAGDTSGGLLLSLEELRHSLKLDGRFHFMGLRSDVPEILAGLDVFVSSSYTEGFSLALVEAMAAGKAAVATRSGGPERILAHERTGLLVPTRDAQALADAILRLADSSLRNELGIAAKAAMTTRYSSARMLADYHALASTLLGLSKSSH